MFRNFLSRKTILMIGIAVFSITLVAILFLSISINTSYETTYKDITAKSFFSKTKALETEFKQIDQHLATLTYLVQSTPRAQLKAKYEILNDVYAHGEMIRHSWFIIVDNNNTILESNFDKRTDFKLKSPYIQAIISKENTNPTNNFIVQKDKMYWLLWNEITVNSNQRILTGFSFDLAALHQHLSNIDVTTPNYAYIFSNDGTCIYHPEINLIGTNIFSQSNIHAQDTITPNTHIDPPVVISEYLQMEVLRFVTQFETSNFNGYISVNFPKVNLDENLTPLKRNTYLIFTSSILLILIVFYFFTAVNKRTYKEKGKIAVEKEKLKKEKALMQLKQLKNQINPHFLFNSLNSLYMLINMDKELAQEFTLNLSKTYRYLITSPIENIVELDQELTFIQQYIELQKIRFTKELFVEIVNKRTCDTNVKIPYLALQITIENALKHNVATIETPLLIKVVITDDTITIINNYQPKKSKEQGENFGLTYLSSIYNYYNNDHYKAQREGDIFVCVLPLFNC